MVRQKLLGSQVKRLLSGVSGQGQQHLTEVETDLVQTTLLLGEAIEKLGASFMAIHEAVHAHQETIDQLLQGKPEALKDNDRLQELRAEIGKHVNAAVTGLQFQDMTSQLIDRTMQRVIGLREVLNVLGPVSDGVDAESDPDAIVDLLQDLNAVLDSQVEKLQGMTWKPVRQTRMDCGDAELF